MDMEQELIRANARIKNLLQANQELTTTLRAERNRAEMESNPLDNLLKNAPALLERIMTDRVQLIDAFAIAGAQGYIAATDPSRDPSVIRAVAFAWDFAYQMMDERRYRLSQLSEKPE